MQSIDYKSPEGVISVGKIYFSWIGQIVTNLGSITGNVAKMNWESNLTSVNNKTIKK